MTPSARVQAAIEILDEVIGSSQSDGPPADTLVARYFKTRRYAGSKDRRAVRELVFRAIRTCGELPVNGRSAMVSVADTDLALAKLFDGSPHGPEAREKNEASVEASLIPAWIQPLLSDHVTSEEWPTLLERAPVDLRANIARVGRKELLGQIEGAKPTSISPWGLRLPPDTRVDDHPTFQQGLFEIQDEGSQLIALACQPKDGEQILDLCAGAGGKSLAIASAAPGAKILASDTNRSRLSQLEPRAERAGARIEARLLDGGRESNQLEDMIDGCDIVLVDAPCSGSGTWRRNPEGRWRLTPERLDRLVKLQARLLEIAAPLVRPGGALIFATCSIIRAEGTDQARNFLGRHSSWMVQDVGFDGGRPDGPGRLLTPAHDATDGFFVARFVRSC